MYSHCFRVVSAPVRAAVITTRPPLNVSIACLVRARLPLGGRARAFEDRRRDTVGVLELRIVPDIGELDDVSAGAALLDDLQHVRPRDGVGHAPHEADRQAGLFYRELPALLVGGALG